MVTIFDTSSVYTNIDIEALCMYTSKNIWLEKEKYLEKLKKPASVLKLILMERVNIKLTPV
jgi:hypothetical protein